MKAKKVKTKRIKAKETKIKEVESSLPMSSTELLSQDIYRHYVNAREVDLYCIVDRSRGFHFTEVAKDGAWSYTGNGKHFDCVVLAERLFHKSKCRTLKYPVYETSKEAMKLYQEFTEFSSKDIKNSTDSAEDINAKTQEYIDKISAVPPVVKEVDQLAYVDGYSGELGFPVLSLSEVPLEVLEQMSRKIARNALSHFSTMSFLHDDNFVMTAEPVVVDPDIFSDIIVTFSAKNLLRL